MKQTVDDIYPTKLNRNAISSSDWIKFRTIELYDFLPQTTLEERDSYRIIRDEVIRLNYKFFGFVAKSTYVASPCIQYEDKFQAGLASFCKMWSKFRFASKYRIDLSFATFFKPRLSEEISRALGEVKYSTERVLKMKAASQLGIHWKQLQYEDLKKVNLPEQEIAALEAMFGVMYPANIEDHDPFLQNKKHIETTVIPALYSDRYDSATDLLIHTMVEIESLISDKDLLKLSEINCIPFETLKELRPQAEAKLKQILENACDTQDVFMNE